MGEGRRSWKPKLWTWKQNGLIFQEHQKWGELAGITRATRVWSSAVAGSELG